MKDNQGVVVWVSEGVRHAKHISIRKNFVRNNVRDGIICTIYCSTKHMKAYILNKPLERLSFEKHRQELVVLHFKP